VDDSEAGLLGVFSKILVVDGAEVGLFGVFPIVLIVDGAEVGLLGVFFNVFAVDSCGVFSMVLTGELAGELFIAEAIGLKEVMEEAGIT